MLNGVCDTCGEKSKYRCPACEKLSCSLNCVRTHKTQSGCSGEVDPTAFLPKADLLTTVALDRDYNFLQKIGRQITLDKQDARGQRVIKPRDQWRAGARVHSVAKGMSRNRMNRSRWNNSESQFEWTVEIRLSGKKEFVQIGDKTLVGDLPTRFQRDATEDVVLIDVYGTRHILNKQSTFQDAIRGKNILEFPTLEITPSISSDTDSSDSDSDSSDSSSDSDSDSDSDSSSHPADGVKADTEVKAQDPELQSELQPELQSELEPEPGPEPGRKQEPALQSEPQSERELMNPKSDVEESVKLLATSDSDSEPVEQSSKEIVK